MKGKINYTYHIILAVLAIAFLIFFTFAVSYIFKSQVVINIPDGSDKSILFDVITSLLGIVSAFFVYQAFNQQLIQRKIDKADKDFDRCINVIDGIIKLLNKINLTIQKGDIVEVKAEDAIDAFIAWLSLDEKKRPVLLNRIDFERNLLIYLSNVSFAAANINKLKAEHREYYDILSSKLIFEVPNIFVHLSELIQYEKEIHSPNDEGRDGMILFKTITELYEYFDIMHKEETPE